MAKWRNAFTIILSVMVLSIQPADSQRQNKDSAVRVDPVERGNLVSLVATNSSYIEEATVTVTARLDNMQSSPGMPCTGIVSGANQRMIIAYLRPLNPSRSWNYQYDFSWQIGLPSSSIPMPFLYLFPFERGATFRVTQGARGAFSHQIGTSDENAIDFAMPEGTVVCAARPGVVIAVKGDSNVGGPDSRFLNYANYVVIKHGDGSYGNYMHFKQNGLLVGLGQQVAAGMPIGLSGNTGRSSHPHLHFDVYWLQNGTRRITLPLHFQTRKGPLEALEGMGVTREE